MPNLIVYTDLDGSLLDGTTYSYEPATPALAALREQGIPLVLVSSKTRAEMEPLRQRLDHRDPFIVENGGAVAVSNVRVHVLTDGCSYAVSTRKAKIVMPELRSE